MKRTTYMMIGAFFAGLLCVAAAAAFLFKHVSVETDGKIGDGDPVAISLPQFTALTIDIEDTDGVSGIGRLDGFIIEECDTVSSPVMRTVSSLRPAMTTGMRGDTLDIRLDFDKLLTSVGENRYVASYIDRKWFATVVVPRGTLQSIDNRWASLKLTGFRSHKLTVRPSEKLILDSCDFDTLVCTECRRLHKISMDDTRIETLALSKIGHQLSVMTSDVDSSYIKKLLIDGSIAKNPTIDVSHVGTTDWKPSTPDQKLSVTLTQPAEIITKD